MTMLCTPRSCGCATVRVPVRYYEHLQPILQYMEANIKSLILKKMESNIQRKEEWTKILLSAIMQIILERSFVVVVAKATESNLRWVHYQKMINIE